MLKSQEMELIQFLDMNVEIIRKKGRRSLTLYMRPDKLLTVKTNRRTTQSEIAEFLLAKQKWIEKNLDRFKATAKLYKPPTFTESSLFPFLGELKYLQFCKTEASRVTFKIEDGFLLCLSPANGLFSDLDSSLKKFYRTEAEVYLKNRLVYLSTQTGLSPTKLSFRSTRARWGSCSSQGHISLNWKLICHTPQLIDYVIVHELCHLKHLNHSAEFWNLVESHFPAHREARKMLNQLQHIGHFLT